MEKASSQDQSASLGSEHNENYGGSSTSSMPGGTLVCNHSASQAEVNQPLVQIPYAYFDPFINGLYAPHTMTQPQVMGAVSGRVALPVEPCEDGPIYVNAKQYHGILRRRKMRAKLEAQNKLVKTRKAYLHESRHMHALNRVRGSGGRFLSTKKTQKPVHGQQHTIGDTLSYNENVRRHGCGSDKGVSMYRQSEDSRFSNVTTNPHGCLDARQQPWWPRPSLCFSCPVRSQ